MIKIFGFSVERNEMIVLIVGCLVTLILCITFALYIYYIKSRLQETRKLLEIVLDDVENTEQDQLGNFLDLRPLATLNKDYQTMDNHSSNTTKSSQDFDYHFDRKESKISPFNPFQPTTTPFRDSFNNAMIHSRSSSHSPEEKEYRRKTYYLPSLDSTEQKKRRKSYIEQKNSFSNSFHSPAELEPLFTKKRTIEQTFKNPPGFTVFPYLTPEVSPEREIHRIVTADLYAEDIDRFIRHKIEFYSPGFVYCVKRLKEELPPPHDLHIDDFVKFLKSRKEFKISSDRRTLQLKNVTPQTEPGIPFLGKFRCINPYCKNEWVSYESYASSYQPCPKCKRKVFPFDQQKQSSKLYQNEDNNLLRDIYEDK